ncbi:MAG: purine-nucleoside/S-methyl-5-thioadenosine phosphorylase / adenosine deaminase [Chthoniobacter sp.]|jgi:copper oxidase (laccase) domain-containing protein|nr:purine-nucleoside/S-methyl-5-thioadenosine phosphorylase / adenosine deaminase [Chthoniobacter sp.]
MRAADAGAFEQFPALLALPGIRHAFCTRAADLEVKVERGLALERLAARHAAVRTALGLADRIFVVGAQVHGGEVAVVDAQTVGPVGKVDGLITADPRVCLGAYVADCCAVYLVDPTKRVIGLLHSGRKGSELSITSAAIERMVAEFGCDPANMVVQLSPCIRPPNYEIDFAALIRRDCERAGVGRIADCGTCTAANLESYYSYRAERGKTGRMLALLALRDDLTAAD